MTHALQSLLMGLFGGLLSGFMIGLTIGYKQGLQDAKERMKLDSQGRKIAAVIREKK